MKRFMLFSFPEYYPSGGIGDVLKDFDSLEEAKEFLERPDIHISSDSCYVFDRIEGRIVYDHRE
jgi:hypothetical protein